MKAQSKKIGKLVGMMAILVAFLTVSLNADASYYGYNRNKARKIINKTAYIIDEAYYIADYYGYWTGSNLSRAVYYNDYAQYQYNRRNYRRAIHYSLRARDYALRVIDGCDEYWDYFYYHNYGWSRYYGYNPYYTGHPGYHYGNYNYYYNTYYNTYHNNQNNNPNYNSTRPNTYNDSRGSNGRTGAFDPNKPNTGNSGRGYGNLRGEERFKNINTESYFDKEELSLMRNLPEEKLMEETFKRDNRGVSFDDKNLRNNTKLIESNRTRAQEFKKTVPEASRQQIKLQEPKRINEVNRTLPANGERKIDNSKQTPAKRMENNRINNGRIENNRMDNDRIGDDRGKATQRATTPQRDIQKEKTTKQNKHNSKSIQKDDNSKQSNNKRSTVNTNKSKPQPRSSSSVRQQTTTKTSSKVERER